MGSFLQRPVSLPGRPALHDGLVRTSWDHAAPAASTFQRTCHHRQLFSHGDIHLCSLSWEG
eukprot:204193-Pelagomonas_calceolata.AAC.2